LAVQHRRKKEKLALEKNMVKRTPTSTYTPVTPKRTTPLWMWAVGVAVLAIAAWQIGHGVFVKSIDAPGGASISFYPPGAAEAGDNDGEPTGAKTAATGANSATIIEQSDGENNSASIHGDHNHIEQHGSSNTATIGGLDEAPPPPSQNRGRP
jgi:hypothetical protein